MKNNQAVLAGEIKVVCASCKERISGPMEAPDNSVSHGICPTCFKKDYPRAYYFGARKALQAKLDSFDREPGAADLNHFFFYGVRP